MLLDDIKQQITTAVKNGDTVARDILRLAKGEIQTAEARKQAALNDEDIVGVLRKLIKGNEETLRLAPEDSNTPVLQREIETLTNLLPKSLSVDEIVTLLSAQHDAIKVAPNDGAATGVAMKSLRATGATVTGADVAAAVKQIRL